MTTTATTKEDRGRSGTFALSPAGSRWRSPARPPLVSERRIPFIEWGRLLRFDPAEIEAWVDRSPPSARHPMNSEIESRTRRSTAGTAVADSGCT